MPLTVIQIKQAKAKEKPYRLKDFNGLFLEVRVTGKKCWRFRGTHNGKEVLLSLGTYPAVSLSKARDKCREYQEQLAHGINPSEQRKQAKDAMSTAQTFESMAREWHGKYKVKWADNYAKTVMRRMEKEVFPFIGRMPANEIQPRQILEVLRIIENRGAHDLAHRMHQLIGQVLRYGVAIGRVDRDNSADIKGALTPVAHEHHPCPKTPRDVARLMKAIYDYQGSHVVRCALRFSAMTFVRPGELRHAKWEDFDLEAAEWRYFVSKTKTQHIVPLSSQALEVLASLHPLTGHGKHVFPGRRGGLRPMSENTVNAALRYLGFSRDEMTAHGFRGMASTALNEMGWSADAIERQLAHSEKDTVRAAYNHADHLPERRRMMQAWADYLDQLRENGRVIPLHHAAGNEA